MAFASALCDNHSHVVQQENALQNLANAPFTAYHSAHSSHSNVSIHSMPDINPLLEAQKSMTYKADGPQCSSTPKSIEIAHDGFTVNHEDTNTPTPVVYHVAPELNGIPMNPMSIVDAKSFMIDSVDDLRCGTVLVDYDTIDPDEAHHIEQISVEMDAVSPPDPRMFESERVRQSLFDHSSLKTPDSHCHQKLNHISIPDGQPHEDDVGGLGAFDIGHHGHSKPQWVSLSDTEVNAISVPVMETKAVNPYKVSLQKDFANDRRAFDTWMACCDVHDQTLGYFNALYPLLCTTFAEWTKCSRVPLASDLESVILKFGAIKAAISSPRCAYSSAAHNFPVITPPDSPTHNKRGRHSHGPRGQYHHGNGDGVGTSCHFATVSDSNHSHHGIDAIYPVSSKISRINQSHSFSFGAHSPRKGQQTFVTLRCDCFVKFWRWFIECCAVVRELAHLWDSSPMMKCDLFCGRERCQEILEEAPPGTFMIRLSSVITGGVVLSYVEPNCHYKEEPQFKHTILIRRGSHQYELKQRKSKKKRKSRGKPQVTSISNLVRSFVKIKFLFSPNCLVPKKNVF